MQSFNKRIKLNNDEKDNLYTINEQNMSVHNISMNAILSSSLNLDTLYKYFANCVYKPREFKCIRIDIPVSQSTVKKYIKYVNEKNFKNKKPLMNISEKIKEETINKTNEQFKEEEINKKNINQNDLIKKTNNFINDQINVTENSSNIENDNCEKKHTILSKNNIIKSNDPNMDLIKTKISPENKNIHFSTVNKNKLQNINDSNISNENELQNINNLNLSNENIINDFDNVDYDETYLDNEKIIINVSIFANGKLICTGNNSVEACKIAMKKVEKKLKQLNFKNVKLKKVTITNILAVYNVGFSIVLPLFAQYYKNVDYDPNVFPACKVKIVLQNNIKNNSGKKGKKNENKNHLAWCGIQPETEKDDVDIISASIFSTGNINLTGGKTYENLKKCIEILLPYLIKSKSAR